MVISQTYFSVFLEHTRESSCDVSHVPTQPLTDEPVAIHRQQSWCPLCEAATLESSHARSDSANLWHVSLSPHFSLAF